MTIDNRPFGTDKAGKPVTCWTLTNKNGMTVDALDWGCVIHSIKAPDKNGNFVDVALGYDDIAGYENGSCFMGAFVGRYANRIKKAEFTLNGRPYQLERNDGQNHLHGSYCHTIFSASPEDDTLVFRYTSPDGEEGYPGILDIQVRYSLSDENELKLEYTAKAEGDTIINLTNHSYFNLAGSGDVLDHQIQLNCGSFTETDPETIPTGRVLPVDNSVLDFRQPKTLRDALDTSDPLLSPYKGFDHNLIFEGSATGYAYCPRSGIRMDLATTQPAVQLYSGNYVDADSAPFGKNGVRYPRHAGFCLETQHYPASPNYPDFPSTVLKDGETYRHTTVYKFSVV